MPSLWIKYGTPGRGRGSIQTWIETGRCLARSTYKLLTFDGSPILFLTTNDTSYQEARASHLVFLNYFALARECCLRRAFLQARLIVS